MIQFILISRKGKTCYGDRIQNSGYTEEEWVK